MLTVCSKEDFNKAKILAQSAAKSGAYLYPIKVSVNPVCLSTTFLTIAGDFLLLDPPNAVEAAPLETRADHVSLGRSHSIHVFLHLSPPACGLGLCERTPGSLHYHS